MKKQVIAVMLSMMMAVGSISGSSVFAAETEAVAAEMTAQEENEIAQEEEAEELEMLEDGEDTDEGVSAEDSAEEESTQLIEEALQDEEEPIAEKDYSDDQYMEEYDDTSDKEDEHADLSDTSANAEKEIDAEEEIVSTEENKASGGIVASGTCGENRGKNLTWTLDNEGTLTISGTGRMESYGYDLSDQTYKHPWPADINRVILSDGITFIGIAAFFGCTGLTSVTMPDSVTIIAAYAFYGCKNLTNLKISNNLNSIGSHAFEKCSRLSNLVIPNSVVETSDHVFDFCYGLTSVEILNGLTKINDGVFYYCTGLTRITIPESVTSIKWNAFCMCTSLTSIFFRGNAPSIGPAAFEYVTATAYYPENDPTWTEDVRQNYGGTITWVPWDPSGGNTFEPVEPVSITGASFKFRSGLKNDDSISYSFDYNDDWVFSSSASDRYKLMQTSLRVAMAAFGAKEDRGYGAKNIKEMMNRMRFGYTSESIDYPEPEADTIGSAIGLKNIKNPDGTTRSIILVALRGGGYGKEWAGDFRVGGYGNKYHEGFRLAADDVEARLGFFINSNKKHISDDLRIWVTGYSRAAAVSNLVAADLINGNCPIDGVGTGEVFAFCFECPQNIVDSNAGSSMYRNIVNIANPIDFVPKVAFDNWGFTRYGITYYTPSKETTSSYNENYKYQMIWKYQDLCDETGITLTEDYVVEVSGQASILDKYFDFVSGKINRTKYYNSHEDTIMDLSGSFLGGGGSPDWGAAVPSIIRLFVEVVAQRPVSTGRVIGMFKKNNTGPGPSAHYPEMCMSWIDSLGSFSKYNTQENSWYRTVLVNCPVEVSVFDHSGNLVAHIIDDDVEEIEDGIVSRIDEDGQKVLVLPQDEEYDVVITATDDAKVNYTVEEYNYDSNTTEKIVNYKDIEVEKGAEITGGVSEADVIGSAEYTLKLAEESEDIEPDEVLTGDDVVSYSVEAASSGNGTVTGGGIYITGEFAQVTAAPDEGYELDGWYSGDELVSEEAEYRFGVKTDTTLTAVFSQARNSSLEDAIISGIENKRYTGKEITQSVSLKYNDMDLAEGNDYTVSYENNVEPGMATVTINGVGSYTGTVTKTFLILPGKTTRGDMFNLANNVKVTWKEVPGAKYYKVYREGVTDKKETRKEPVIVTERLIGWDKEAGLTNGHAYRYKIVASLTGKDDSSGDSTLSYSKLMYRLKTVVIRSVKNTAPGAVTIKYDKTTSGDSYVLQYSDNKDMKNAKTKVVLGADNTSYVLKGLKKGKTYYISIRVRKKVNGIDYYTTFGVAKQVKITK